MRSCMGLLRRLGLVAGCLLGLAPGAHADMWVYVDARGVKHYASSQLDKRYTRMFRSVAMPEMAPDAGVAGASMAVVARAQAPLNPAVVKTADQLRKAPGYLAVQDHVQEAAQANGVDSALLQAVIAAESGFDPGAVSPKGAVGLMQLMPATAQRYGVTSDRAGSVVSKLADPKTNIHTGARYLRDLIKLFPGRLELALAAYNAGEGAVQKAGNRVPAYRETQNYVSTVMRLYQRLSAQPAR